MASTKKRRKAAKLGRERTRPVRQKDGDRRRRGGPTYEQGLADKQAMQQFGAGVPAGPEEEG
jgi:hypothetical protein